MMAAKPATAPRTFRPSPQKAPARKRQTPLRPLPPRPRRRFAGVGIRACSNSIIWVRADASAVMTTFGALYEAGTHPSQTPGGAALLELTKGTEVWRVATTAHAFPAALFDDTVVLGTADGTVLGIGRADGSERWRLEFPGVPFQAIRSGDTVVIADADPETWGPHGLVDKTRMAGHVWGLDPRTGEVKWRTKVGAFNAFIAATDLLVIAAGTDHQGGGEVAALDPGTGAERWRTAAQVASPPALGDSVVVVPGSQLLALNLSDGSLRWGASPATEAPTPSRPSPARTSSQARTRTPSNCGTSATAPQPATSPSAKRADSGSSSTGRCTHCSPVAWSDWNGRPPGHGESLPCFSRKAPSIHSRWRETPSPSVPASVAPPSTYS